MEANQSSSLIPSTVEVAMQLVQKVPRQWTQSWPRRILEAVCLPVPAQVSCPELLSVALWVGYASRSRGWVSGRLHRSPILADDKYYMDMVATADATSELH